MQSKRYIVTGGGGFLGGAIARRLCADGHEVISISRGDYPKLAEAGIRQQRADLSGKVDEFAEIFRGAAAVFHVAAKVDMWGDYAAFFAGNVQATRNVIEACRAHGVRKLIFTSSPSVVANGGDLSGVDESVPYPERYTAFYPQTKAQAEREVLAANGTDLFTISLRPHLIWGGGDTNLLPTILERARAGRLVRVGGGENLVDLTYIEDCVEAHILAERALDECERSRGQAYFISQNEPTKLWGWIDQVLACHGIPAVKKHLPKSVAMTLAWIFEAIGKVTGKEPLFTRFLVCEMATSHYFNINRAIQDLGFKPRYSMREAMERTFGEAFTPGLR